MRLSERQQDIIRRAVESCFGRDARVLVFGSRLDDARRGGDIDLLVESDLTGEALFAAEQRLYARLQRLLGERRIDLITHSRGAPANGIRRHVLETGVLL